MEWKEGTPATAVMGKIAFAFPICLGMQAIWERSNECSVSRPKQQEKCHASSTGYALKAGQLTYDCRYSTMHGMPVTGGRGFRGLKPFWYNGVPP